MGLKVIAGEATGTQSVVLAVSFTAEKSRGHGLSQTPRREGGRPRTSAGLGAKQSQPVAQPCQFLLQIRGVS